MGHCYESLASRFHKTFFGIVVTWTISFAFHVAITALASRSFLAWWWAETVFLLPLMCGRQGAIKKLSSSLTVYNIFMIIFLLLGILTCLVQATIIKGSCEIAGQYICSDEADVGPWETLRTLMIVRLVTKILQLLLMAFSIYYSFSLRSIILCGHHTLPTVGYTTIQAAPVPVYPQGVAPPQYMPVPQYYLPQQPLPQYPPVYRGN